MAIVDNNKVTLDIVYKDGATDIPVRFFYEGEVAKIAFFLDSSPDAEAKVLDAKLLVEVIEHLKSKGALRDLTKDLKKTPSPKSPINIFNPVEDEGHYGDFIGSVLDRSSDSEDEEQTIDIGSIGEDLDALANQEKVNLPKAKPVSSEELEKMKENRAKAVTNPNKKERATKRKA